MFMWRHFGVCAHARGRQSWMLIGALLLLDVAQSAALAQAGGAGGAGPGARWRPPGDPPRERWSLGVAIRVLDTGVEITDVLPRSAAERAGLERRDVLITVNGVQVGRVNGREVNLDDELQRAADRRGRVRLLVQNRRDRELLNLEVQLDRETIGGGGGGGGGRNLVVYGTASYRERIAVPPGSRLRVRLVERGGVFQRDRTVAEEVYGGVGNGPYRYELTVPRNQLSDDARYELLAELQLPDGRLFMRESRAERVSPTANAVQVDILLVRS